MSTCKHETQEKDRNQAFNFNLSQPVGMAGMPRAVRVRARVARVFGSGGWTSVVARLELLFDLFALLDSSLFHLLARGITSRQC